VKILLCRLNSLRERYSHPLVANALGSVVRTALASFSCHSTRFCFQNGTRIL